MDCKTNYAELKRVSTYAREKGISVQTVYKQIEQGKIKSEKIPHVSSTDIRNDFSKAEKLLPQKILNFLAYI